MNVQCVAMDVHQLLYGRVTLHKWTSISFYMDVLHDIRERPRVSIWTYNMWPWTSTSYYMDVQHYICGRPPVSTWTYNVRPWTSTRYYKDVQHNISFYMDVQRLAVEVHQLLYGRAILHKSTFISSPKDVQHDINGRPPISLWTYNVWSRTSTIYCMDVQHFINGCPSVSPWTYDITSMDFDQFLYGCTTSGHGRPPVTIWTYKIT